MDKAVIVARQCVSCNAKDVNGEVLRDKIDSLKATGEPTRKIVDFLRGNGVKISQPNLDRHLRLHSPWVVVGKEVKARETALTEIKKLEVRGAYAEEAIQKIVDAGTSMVDNWIEGKDSIKMPVSENMYLKALDLQTKTADRAPIRDLVMVFGEALVEGHKKDRKIEDGEVVEE